MPASFSIEEIKLIKANFSSKGDPRQVIDNSADNTPEERPINTTFTCSTSFNDENFKLCVILGVKTEESKIPFTFDIAMCGNFIFNEKPTPKEVESAANVNCPGIIFPYLREVVSDLTKRGGYSPCVFEPMNFLALYKQRKEAEAKAEVTGPSE